MDKDVYIKEVAHRLHMRFSQLKEGVTLAEGNRYRLEGFMQAGNFMGLTNNVELNRVMEKVHMDVFGQTLAQRKESLDPQWQDEVIDYTAYDSPSYQRQS
jgi:hypothetical protein